jgi:hypothetical protein
MPASPTAKKVSGLGVQLQATIGGTLTTIASRVSIDGPDGSVGVKETTDLDSTAVERRPLLPDGGDLSMQVFLDPDDATHTFLAGLWTAPPPLPIAWKLIFPTTTPHSGTFNGILTGYKPGGMATDGYLTCDIKISLSGVPVWA